MKKKVLSVAVLGVVVLSTQAFGFGSWGANSDSSFRENLKKQIRKELNSNRTIQKTRAITPVATKTQLMKQAQQTVSGGTATSTTVATSSQTATLSSESSKQQVAAIGETTKIFGGNTVVSSAAVTSTVKLASGGSAGASGYQGVKRNVNAICGDKNFDDMAVMQFGGINFDDIYIDKKGQVCDLKNMDIRIMNTSNRAEWVRRLCGTSGKFYSYSKATGRGFYKTCFKTTWYKIPRQSRYFGVEDLGEGVFNIVGSKTSRYPACNHVVSYGFAGRSSTYTKMYLGSFARAGAGWACTKARATTTKALSYRLTDYPERVWYVK